MKAVWIAKWKGQKPHLQQSTFGLSPSILAQESICLHAWRTRRCSCSSHHQVSQEPYTFKIHKGQFARGSSYKRLQLCGCMPGPGSSRSYWEKGKRLLTVIPNESKRFGLGDEFNAVAAYIHTHRRDSSRRWERCPDYAQKHTGWPTHDVRAAEPRSAWVGKLCPEPGLATAFCICPVGTEGLGQLPTLDGRQKQRGKSPTEERAERSCLHGASRAGCRQPALTHLLVPTLGFWGMSMVFSTESCFTARPRSAMAQLSFLFTRMFLDFRSRCAMAGLPVHRKRKQRQFW